jgi:hypothetical protein
MVVKMELLDIFNYLYNSLEIDADIIGQVRPKIKIKLQLKNPITNETAVIDYTTIDIKDLIKEGVS